MIQVNRLYKNKFMENSAIKFCHFIWAELDERINIVKFFKKKSCYTKKQVKTRDDARGVWLEVCC